MAIWSVQQDSRISGNPIAHADWLYGKRRFLGRCVLQITQASIPNNDTVTCSSLRAKATGSKRCPSGWSNENGNALDEKGKKYGFFNPISVDSFCPVAEGVGSHLRWGILTRPSGFTQKQITTIARNLTYPIIRYYGTNRLHWIPNPFVTRYSMVCLAQCNDISIGDRIC